MKKSGLKSANNHLFVYCALHDNLPKMASAFPSRSFFCLGLKSYLWWSLWSFQGGLSFPWHLLSMQKVYMFIKLLSPDNLCLMMEKEGSTKNLEGEREIYFPPIYMQRNNTQQWKGMKHQPLKGINLRCTWLSERIQLKRLHPVWPHCDILGKVKLHRW